MHGTNLLCTADQFGPVLQVNLFQNLLFLQQLPHNMTTDCSWNYHEQSFVILWVSLFPTQSFD